MSVLNYTKNLKLFDNYEYHCINAFIKEYIDTSDPLFAFLNVLKPQDVQIYWYHDSNENVLGGYHLLSGFMNNKYAIYINDIFEDTDIQQTEKQDENYISMFNNSMDKVYLTFPTIIHELKHYSQFQIYGKLIYGILQLPIIRQFTIEKEAYKLSDILQKKLQNASLGGADNLILKIKYKFPQIYFNKRQLQIKKILDKNNITWDKIPKDFGMTNYIIQKLQQDGLIKQL